MKIPHIDTEGLSCTLAGFGILFTVAVIEIGGTAIYNPKAFECMLSEAKGILPNAILKNFPVRPASDCAVHPYWPSIFVLQHK